MAPREGQKRKHSKSEDVGDARGAALRKAEMEALRERVLGSYRNLKQEKRLKFDPSRGSGMTGISAL